MRSSREDSREDRCHHASFFIYFPFYKDSFEVRTQCYASNMFGDERFRLLEKKRKKYVKSTVRGRLITQLVNLII